MQAAAPAAAEPVSNALKYTKNGRVSCGARGRRRGRLRIEVLGTPASASPRTSEKRVLQEFKRLDAGAASRRPGLGLIVERMARCSATISSCAPGTRQRARVRGRTPRSARSAARRRWCPTSPRPRTAGATAGRHGGGGYRQRSPDRRRGRRDPCPAGVKVVRSRQPARGHRAAVGALRCAPTRFRRLPSRRRRRRRRHRGAALEIRAAIACGADHRRPLGRHAAARRRQGRGRARQAR